MGLAPNIPATQCIALGKSGGWLSVLRMALWDWEKVYTLRILPQERGKEMEDAHPQKGLRDSQNFSLG